jgi:hypothetical protein
MKLTVSARKKIPSGKFAGPDRSFPITDKNHARAAISGATRSEHAGNISAATADKVKSRARKFLRLKPNKKGA